MSLKWIEGYRKSRKLVLKINPKPEEHNQAAMFWNTALDKARKMSLGLYEDF